MKCTAILTLLGLSGLSQFAFARRRKLTVRMIGLLIVALAAGAGAVRADAFDMPAGQTSLQFVPVGDPGNAADATGFGAVPYSFEIGKYEVTTAQYCQFLNAVAKTDAYGLYNFRMGSPSLDGYRGCGIVQSGDPGQYTYSPLPDAGIPGQPGYVNYASFPVNYITWGNAARFCNWLQNGQPTGDQGPGTTETGAYTLDGANTNSSLLTISRNAGALYFIPSENEWYKAAFYKGGGVDAGYWLYPTKSDSVPSNILTPTGTNNANFYQNASSTDPVNGFTPVGAFLSAPGPYGTFDQAGNVEEWNEGRVGNYWRGARAGGYYSEAYALKSTERRGNDPLPYYASLYGFRVASVPESSALALLGMGGIGLLAFAWRRRKN